MTTTFDLVTSVASFIVFVLVLLRTWLQNPRLRWSPSCSSIECLAYDLLACAAGLKGWVVFQGEVKATLNDAALAATLAIVCAFGTGKVLVYTWRTRLERESQGIGSFAQARPWRGPSWIRGVVGAWRPFAPR